MCNRYPRKVNATEHYCKKYSRIKTENIYKVVEHLLIEELKIPEREVGSYSNNFGIVRVDVAHRLGRYTDQSIRPIVIFFETRQAKDYVMSFVRNLRGSRISVGEQFPEVVRSKRSAQMDKLKELKAQGQKVKISVSNLYANNQLIDPEFK